MAPKTEAERIFGAACLRVTLERSGHDPARSEIYKETLNELNLSDGQVMVFLDQHRREVESRLDEHGGAAGRVR